MHRASPMLDRRGTAAPSCWPLLALLAACPQPGARRSDGGGELGPPRDARPTDAPREARPPADASGPTDAGGPADAADASCLPGGKQNFVVVLGSVVADQTTNWVRIGRYTFRCDDPQRSAGTVTTEHWRYNQTTHRHDRVLTGAQGTDCTPAERDCELRTAGSFATDVAAEETWTATYTVTGAQLTIAWQPGQQERWTIAAHPDGDLVQLAPDGHLGLDPPPTHGWAYGSNAAYSSAATPAELHATYGQAKLVFEYFIWNRSAVASGKPAFLMSGWGLCQGAQTLGRTGCRTLAADGGGCKLPADPHWCAAGQSPMMYYIADLPHADRRNIYEFWTLCLAEGRGETCYTGNSHVRPLMQVIDDHGGWHGWVGVEASKGYDVQGDYIGVFRKVDF